MIRVSIPAVCISRIQMNHDPLKSGRSAVLCITANIAEPGELLLYERHYKERILNPNTKERLDDCNC